MKDKQTSKTKSGATGPAERWLADPEEHDFPAAEDYLSLLLPTAAAASVVDQLRQAGPVWRKAKDLMRASRLPLLPADDPEVANDLKKVSEGKQLSPVLLLQGDATRGWPLEVADGYHRICASYHLDPGAEVPCRLAVLP